MNSRNGVSFAVVASIIGATLLWPGVAAQAPSSAVRRGAPAAAAPRVDDEYTRLIRETLQDPRITTELVDHLPASDTVPSPLAFFGRIVGTPGELTYARDIHRYLETLARVSPRARFWRIGRTEEGRDIVVLAIADEATIGNLESYGRMLGALTDPRRTTESQARNVMASAKPIYYVTSGIHSPETGGPEMLMELAYRLIVEDTPFIRNIREHVITFITPVLEVDGREKQVDTYYFNKARGPGAARLPLVYWGKYVGHDNNRDGIGQFLQLTQAVTRVTLEWHPTVIHDLHESQTYLYVSTGTGPYNTQLDPIAVSEWWTLAQNDVMEMTKRGVPGVWTYGFYDGWVPNYLFFIAHTHNATGRFYEVQRYGPDIEDIPAGRSALSREWYRPNPPLPTIRWGPRNNVNIQQSALLFSLAHVARNRDVYLENYWLKSRRAWEKGRTGPVFAWVIPARQRRQADAAAAVNDLRRQGLEVSRATRALTAGAVSIEPGDYIVRGDQPFRTIADMYFAVQNYPPQNPVPYDDTGWTYAYLRDLSILEFREKSVLDEPMTPIRDDVRADGGIEGDGTVVIVDNTADTALVTFRLRQPDTEMSAAEEPFEAAGRRFAAGSIIVPDADRAAIDPVLVELGLSAVAVTALPDVRSHPLDVPRIGLVHTWTHTQDEGWWRAALDVYGVPYKYFADQKLRDGGLRAQYDVLILPHSGGTAAAQVGGIPVSGPMPLPYRRSAATPNLGSLDESDDIRGGMGDAGLAELVRFVEEGGTLIVDGSASTILPAYGRTPGVVVEEPRNVFVRGSIVRARVVDPTSPIVYGYEPRDLPVYFSSGPVLKVGDPPPAGRGRSGDEPVRGGPGSAGFGQNIAPNAEPLRIKPLDDPAAAAPDTPFLTGVDPRARVVLRFPNDPANILLSGTLGNGAPLASKALAVDYALGRGHVVMFALRPMWRWQTHGTYPLVFNTILNWNDLAAGRGRTPGERTVH